ncbi:hypothetical protein [Malaciobacter marinus]|uniref:hypothetical protein n=1 Tax=Malaciobacter marinus TaxID=505249 RepID=UPI003B007041
MNKNRKSAKKRMMFIQREDYNFLTYNFLILLNELNCVNEDKRFNDFRKIAYLIEFISNDIDIEKYTEIELSNIYLRAQLKKKLLSHLIITLKNKQYLGISLNTTHRTLDVWINKEKIPDDFFNSKYFFQEISNIQKLKKFVRVSSKQKLKTMIDNLYTNRGVLTWEV